MAPACNLRDFLERNKDKDVRALADAIDGACAYGLLSARRHKSLTLLVPADAALKKLTKLLSSDDEGQLEEGLDLLGAHVLTPCYGGNAGLKEAGTYANGNGKAVKVSGDSFAGVPATEYRGAFNPKRKNLSAWKLKGDLPAATEDAANIVGADGRVHRGGADDARASAATAEVENAYLAWVNNRGGRPNPFALATAALLLAMKTTDGGSYNRALPLLDSDPAVSWYVLVSPDVPSQRVASDAALAAWTLGGASDPAGVLRAAVADLDKLPGLSAEARGKALAAAGRCRGNVSQNGAGPRLYKGVSGAYAALAQGQIDGAQVLPGGGNADSLLARDETRFIIRKMMSDAGMQPGERIMSIHQFLSDNAGRAAFVCGAADQVRPTMFHEACSDFVRSADFLHIVPTDMQMSGAGVDDRAKRLLAAEAAMLGSA